MNPSKPFAEDNWVQSLGFRVTVGPLFGQSILVCGGLHLHLPLPIRTWLRVSVAA